MDLEKNLKGDIPFEIIELPQELPVVKGLSYNSGDTHNGDLFFAIRGYTSDGHSFIENAVENGACAIICQEKNPNTDIPQIVVSDSRRALSFLSSKFYDFSSDETSVIGVTGTNGKTTTCSIIERILEENGERTGVIGTIDYHYKLENGQLKTIESKNTTPESKELHKYIHDMKKNGVRYIIMEVSSHAIALDRVADIDFHTLVFTNLTQDHLDFHKSMEEYANVKSDFIISRFKKNSKVKAVININNSAGSDIAERLKEIDTERLLTYSTSREADLKTENTKIGIEGTKGDLKFMGRFYPFTSPLAGEFNIENLLASAGTAISVSIPPEDCSRHLAKAGGVPGRLEQVKTTKRPNIFVDYAHTPDALENVLKTLKPLCRKRLICIFGCGGDRDSAKRPLMGSIAGKYADISIITSDNPRTEDPDRIISDVEEGIKKEKRKKENNSLINNGHGFYIIEKDRRRAIAKGIEISRYEDCILIAGKGHETYQIVGTEKLSFDDRKTAFEEAEKMEWN